MRRAGDEMKTQISILAAMITLSLSGQVCAADNVDTLQDMLMKGEAHGMFRYRFENVDQQGIDKQANASTLLTRLNYKTGTLMGVQALLEFDNVTVVGNDNYNNTLNGKANYPVVADPKGTEVNQASLKYSNDTLAVIAGRQRINLDDQRFVGGVAWRQNEQTFDGLRAVYQPNSALKIDYSYVYNVNRIFGENSDKGDLSGDLHLANGGYQFNRYISLTAFAYLLDFDDAAALSTQTLGLRATGELSDSIKYTLSYAGQKDYGDNPTSFSSDYFLAELKGTIKQLGWTVGYEVLGADNGVSFSTPLATAHKFQGFADKFLSTPATGIEDLYLGLNGKVANFKLSATYHQFKSDVDGIDYGNEIDLSASYALSKQSSMLFKYANYDAGEHATDTEKYWLMMTYKY